MRYHPDHAHARWIIFPDDSWYRLWNWVVTFILLYTAFVTPTRIALADEDTLDWFLIDLVVDGLFFIDLLINWFLAYYDIEHVLVISNKRIFVHYLTGWMLLDLLSWIPFQILFSEANKDYTDLIRLARLKRLYRLIKIAKLARILKVVKYRSNFIRNINDLFKIGLGTHKLIIFLVTFLLLVHLTAWFWIIIGKYNEDSHDNWIYQHNYIDGSDIEVYTAAFYWAIQTTTTVGYGDITAHNTAERFLCAFVQISGVLMFGYTIKQISSILTNVDAKKVELDQKIGLLKQIAEKHGLGNILINRWAKALEYEIEKKGNHDELLADLPNNLRNQLLITIHQKQISNNAFFEDKPVQFVAQIAPHLRQIRLEKRESIYQVDDLATEMYFVIKGEVTYMILDDEREIPYLTIPVAYYFGELELLLSGDSLRKENAQATEVSELLCLSDVGLFAALEKYKDITQSLMDSSLARKRRNDDAKNRAQELIKRNMALMIPRRWSFAGFNELTKNLSQDTRDRSMSNPSPMASSPMPTNWKSDGTSQSSQSNSQSQEHSDSYMSSSEEEQQQARIAARQRQSSVVVPNNSQNFPTRRLQRFSSLKSPGKQGPSNTLQVPTRNAQRFGTKAPQFIQAMVAQQLDTNTRRKSADVSKSQSNVDENTSIWQDGTDEEYDEIFIQTLQLMQDMADLT